MRARHADARCRAAIAGERVARTSAGTRRARARSGIAVLLSLSGAKTCVCVVVEPLELAQTCRTRVLRSVGLRFVEPVTIARVLSLGAQIV